LVGKQRLGCRILKRVHKVKGGENSGGVQSKNWPRPNFLFHAETHLTYVKINDEVLKTN